MSGQEREPRAANAASDLDATRPPATTAATLPGGDAASDLDATRPPATVGATQQGGDVGTARTQHAPASLVPEGAAAIDETQVRSTGAFAEQTRLRSSVGFVDDPIAAVVPVGARIGRFVVLRELGRGAMGVVFAAYDEELDRKVAIKLLHAGRGADASHGRSMLLREAQALARLAHPNVVAVHEVGVHDGAVFVAMEYIAGLDLQRWLAAAPRSWAEVLAVMRQAGDGLVAAHREGLVHRDFKPSNVLVGDDGRVRVADFGLAARRSDDAARNRTGAGVSLTATLSGEGALVGTPLYMAPELLRGAPATALSDQYAYCVALWEALFEARPYHADDLAGLRFVVEHQELPEVSPRPDVPAWLFAAVRRGLARPTADRWPNLAALVDLLARDPGAERRLRRRRALQIFAAIAGTAAIVAALVLGYGAVRSYTGERQAETRLDALREQIGALRSRGELTQAARLLDTFVTLPENRGTAVIARAHLEWAAVQDDHAAAIDAYASAYIAARTPADGHHALHGLISRLSARGQVEEAAAALAVLERVAPDEAADPDLHDVRLAAALSRRDLAAASRALAGRDPGGWSAVFEDMSHVTATVPDRFGGHEFLRGALDVSRMHAVDFDGDGAQEVVVWTGGKTLRVLRRDLALTPVRTIDTGSAVRVRALEPIVAGEPLIVATYPTTGPHVYDLQLLTASADGATRVLDRWDDSALFHPASIDADRDGTRELYLGTEAYARRFWRLQRGPDGAWSRRSAHAPTDAVQSDVTGVVAADLDGDGQPELVVGTGPWKAYDLRVFKPRADGELDLVARRAFGPVYALQVVRVGDRDVVAFVKFDHQIAPDRFPTDRPLGEPGGLYVIGLATDGIEVLGHVPSRPENGPQRHFHSIFAGDLDGDGHEELVVELLTEGLALLRWRPDQPLQPQIVAGLRPLLVTDLDGDRDAELVVADRSAGGRVLVLGAGDTTLPSLPTADAVPRAVPPGIADPAIAAAWANAEQLVAIGLPGRTAAELSAIARLAGPVAPDMLLRTAELFAAVGDDARAAEHFVAAATRPDITPAALAGAAQARLRLGEFAAAEALTHRRLAAVADSERASVEAELAKLTAATAPRPEINLGFTRPLDPRWRVHDPVAVRRGLARGELSVWASPTPVLAEYPLVWDGGPAALEVELETDGIEWGTSLTVAVIGQDDLPWLMVRVGGYGQSQVPYTDVHVTDDNAATGFLRATAPTISGRIAVFPAFGEQIRETTIGDSHHRTVSAMSNPTRPLQPPPGPLRLRLLSLVTEPGYVAHVRIKHIRLTGFTTGDPQGPDDPAARMLVEGDFAGALTALGQPARDDPRAVWRIDALLGLGQLPAATQAMSDVLAGATASPAYLALYQRLRRDDPVAMLAARPAFGPRLVDLLLQPGGTLLIRPGDVETALAALPTTPIAAADDPETRERQIVTDYTRGAAHERAGQLLAAKAAYAAAFARLPGDPASLQRKDLRSRLLERQMTVAAALRDRDATLQWVRTRLDESDIPYLLLERMQSDTTLTALLGEATWYSLHAELRATRP